MAPLIYTKHYSARDIFEMSTRRIIRDYGSRLLLIKLAFSASLVVLYILGYAQSRRILALMKSTTEAKTLRQVSFDAYIDARVPDFETIV